jgi:hypothetical protein
MADVENQACEQYAELIDKKLCSALSESETAELQRLETALDEAEAYAL